MTGKELLDRIGDADPKLVEAADAKSVGNRRKKWVAMAACLCVVALGIGITSSLFSRYPFNTNGIPIPAMSAEGINNPMASMIPLVVYQDRVYIEEESYGLTVEQDGTIWSYDGIDEKAFTQIESLFGKYLGQTRGNISEYSNEEEYEKDLASTLGDVEVYTVKGYSPFFRLGIYWERHFDSGETKKAIMFMENLNGIFLETGKDLLDDRLRIPGRWTKVEYQADLSDGFKNGEYQPLEEISSQQIDQFIADVCRSPFVDMKAKREESGFDFFEEHETLAYIRFTLEDGTRSEFRMKEGGYLWYYGLDEYPIKVDSELFSIILQACKP